MVKQYFRYITGRLETPSDSPRFEESSKTFGNSSSGFKELMISLVRNRETLLMDERNMYVASNHKAP